MADDAARAPPFREPLNRSPLGTKKNRAFLLDYCSCEAYVGYPAKHGFRRHFFGPVLCIFPNRLRVIVCLASVSLVACGPGAPPKRPAPDVGVVTIKTEPAELTAVLPGRTDPYAVSDVRPQVGGILKARLFTEGALVQQGQALYQIDPASYKAAYDNAAAVLAAAKAKAARYAALQKQNAIAGQDYDDAIAAYKQAQANTETARINLGYTRITAPIGGRIGRSSVTPGALLTADQTTPLATIQTLDPIYVDITQSSSEVLALKLAVWHGSVNTGPADARATLTLDNGTQYPNDGRLQFSEVNVDRRRVR